MVTFPIYPHMSRVKPPIYSLYVHGYPLTPIHIMWAIRYIFVYFQLKTPFKDYKSKSRMEATSS